MAGHRARRDSAVTLNNMRKAQESTMTLGTILLIVLVLMLIGAVPAWPHSAGWGYGPSGVLGVVVAVLVVLLLMGRI